MRITLDGFVATPEGKEDWELKPDKKLWEVIDWMPDSSDTLLMGRKFAQMAIPHFERVPQDNPKFAFSQKIVNIPKVIFSRTLEKSFGKNTTLAKGNLSEVIADFKNQPGEDILVYGGAGFVSSLIAGDHIDDFYLIVVPVLINKGMRIFDLLQTRRKLSLVNATAYENGATLLHYKLNK